ncbi:MAG: DUF3326 domain-containing protein [Candidatus Gastranaerophilales bacterium]|nr:DUF3326 domain-containing protein [Candidatus Gastranaerophilales bacterium]
MKFNNKKTGAFIVPTGIGASIGGYAGDAGSYARKFAKETNLIVNPNVVNAGGFSAITDTMLYTEGYTLDSFFKGEINLVPSTQNKIGIIYDKAIPKDVLNIHINTHNAVKCVYGIDVTDYIITEEEAGVEFYLTEDNISVGTVKNIETIGKACQELLNRGCEAIAVVCLFEEPEDENPDYANGQGTDPVGGVEAIISHYISKHFKVPCAHSPAFRDYTISPNPVNAKSASEYITPTFLPCILLGLSQAPKISKNLNEGLNITDLDFLVMPYDSLGSIPVFEAIKRNIKTFAILENTTELEITKNKLFKNSNITEVETYEKALEIILKS